ncbi:MAG TPA: hypothetical protein VFC38_09935 [Stellaceae bacterium]|nr:hypothetical protein [Stellaceae bacterium]
MLAIALLLHHGLAAAQTGNTPLPTAKPGQASSPAADAGAGTAATRNDTDSADSEVIQANGLIRAKRFAEAKRLLTAHLASHPNDKDAEALLGVADANLNDRAGAVAAFDAAGKIPESLTVVAAKAYADSAVDALKANDNPRAVALSTKALALQENVNTLFIRGTAYANAQNYAGAIADLEKAKTQATAGHADAATLNAIDASLATSLIFGGQDKRGFALARALKQRDPANTRIDDMLAAYYNQQAVAAMQAGDKAGAVARLEDAARAVPSRAADLYAQAANVLSQGQSPDWGRVEAEAGKGLAIDGNDPRANYVVGIAKANRGDRGGAVPYLQKAKAHVGADAQLRADIDAALKQLGAP